MRAGVLVAAVASVLSLVAVPATGAAPPTGWDGSNPFNCTLQQAGLGPTGPDPGADPYCIDFDKRHQNVTELGVVDFLSHEPARVAAASPKCFYFQSDHWRGSIVESDGSTKTYEWDGHYFFDKARSEGGAWVTNFNVNGHTGDPSAMPGMPQDWARYFGPGTGGVITHNEVPADPSCVAKAGQGSVYTQGARREFLPPVSAPPAQCGPASGEVGPGRLGPVHVRDTDDVVRVLLGDPVRVVRSVLRFCSTAAGKLVVAERRSRATLILASGAGFRTRAGIGPGSRVRALRHARLAARLGATRVVRARGVLFGVRGRSVRFVAVYDRAAYRTPRALAAALRLTR
jgi:hypothetical protein